MLSDHEIAHQARVEPIRKVAQDLGVDARYLIGSNRYLMCGR